MSEAILEFLQGIPPELATIVISALPIFELRGGIPVALFTYDLPVAQAILLSLIGNTIPTVLLLWWLDPVSRWLSLHSRHFDRFFKWLFERTHKKFYEHHQKWGDVGLVIFVAIPLPMTGVYTGAVAAFLFGIPFRRAFPLLLLAECIAAAIVTGVSLLA